MNMRKKLPFALAAAAAIAGSLALAAPSAGAYPSQPCTQSALGFHAWDGPGYSGQEYVCSHSDEKGWYWRAK